ncbi:hypothetical protein [Erythrobacter colymbi]|uniref:hypothetical protein n=1 Tax=Erythrobacter colymbi TaxID=1161202 RepID=UPI000A3B60FB|nr:hypothetical protein [Erythrobacter colymbi]
MSITSLFERLNAPLANNRWSWGGIDQTSKRVFLRAWQDQTVVVDGLRFVRLAHHEAYTLDPDNLGYQERLRHLEAIRMSHEVYVVMCRARDVKARPREIASYDDRDVFKIGRMINLNGDEWGEIVERVPVRQLG